MAKKKKRGNDFINLIAILLSLGAILVFILSPMLQITLGEEGNNIIQKFSGPGMIFGGTVEVNSTTTTTLFGKTTTTIDNSQIENIALNKMALIALCLVALGVIITLFVTMKKSFLFGMKPNPKILKFHNVITLIAGILLISGGIIMLTVKNSSIIALNATNLPLEYFALGLGPIVSACLSIIAGTSITLSLALKNK